MTDITDNTLNSYAKSLYAIMDNDGNLLTINNRTIHATRCDARAYRKLTNKKNARIVRAQFSNHTNWVTAK